jgi:hypothetical protein
MLPIKRGFEVLWMRWRVICTWPCSWALFEALGAEVVKQRAADGEGEAQFSQGCSLLSEAGLALQLGLHQERTWAQLEDRYRRK